MRRKSNQRLESIALAALTVFTRRGFRQAQMSEVAAEAGVSSGSLYGYVENKEALLKLAILAAVGRSETVDQLPLPCAGSEEAVAVVRQHIEQHMRWSGLDGLQTAQGVASDEAIGAVIRELFDILSRSRQLIWLLDRLALELPEFRVVHFEELKLPYLAALARLLERFAPTGSTDPQLMARGVLEFVAWFAMHRHRDALVPSVSDEEALAMVLTLLRGGLFGPAPH